MPIKASVSLGISRWSSTEYFLFTSITNFDAAKSLALELCRKRVALCGGGVAVTSCVLSQEEKPGTPATTGDSEIVDLTGNGTTSGVILADDVVKGLDANPDVPTTSLQCRYSDPPGLRRANRPLGWIPDSIIGMGPGGKTVRTDTDWFERFKAYRKFLTSGSWAFWGRKTAGGLTAPQEVLQLIQQGAAPSYWAVVTDTSGPLLPVKMEVQLKGFRHTTGAIYRWQGHWRVDSVVEIAGPPARRQYFLRNSQNLDAGDVLQLGKVMGVEYEPVPISICNIVAPVGRKRGVGYNPPVGRSRPRRR